MLEQRFHIEIVNEDRSFTTQLYVRSRQLFRSVNFLIASQLRVYICVIALNIEIERHDEYKLYLFL